MPARPLALARRQATALHKLARSVLHVHKWLLAYPTLGLCVRYLVCWESIDASAVLGTPVLSQNAIWDPDHALDSPVGLQGAVKPQFGVSFVPSLFGGGAQCYTGWHLLHVLVAVNIMGASNALWALAYMTSPEQYSGSSVHLPSSQLAAPGAHLLTETAMMVEFFTFVNIIMATGVAMDIMPLALALPMGVCITVAIATGISVLLPTRHASNMLLLLALALANFMIMLLAIIANLLGDGAADFTFTIFLLVLVTFVGGVALGTGLQERMLLREGRDTVLPTHVLLWVNHRISRAVQVQLWLLGSADASASLERLQHHEQTSAASAVEVRQLAMWEPHLSSSSLSYQQLLGVRRSVASEVSKCTIVVERMLTQRPGSSAAHLVAAEYFSSSMVCTNRHRELFHIAKALKAGGALPWVRIQCWQRLFLVRRSMFSNIAAGFTTRNRALAGLALALTDTVSRMHEMRDRLGERLLLHQRKAQGTTTFANLQGAMLPVWSLARDVSGILLSKDAHGSLVFPGAMQAFCSMLVSDSDTSRGEEVQGNPSSPSAPSDPSSPATQPASPHSSALAKDSKLWLRCPASLLCPYQAGTLSGNSHLPARVMRMIRRERAAANGSRLVSLEAQARASRSNQDTDARAYFLCTAWEPSASSFLLRGVSSDLAKLLQLQTSRLRHTPLSKILLPRRKGEAIGGSELQEKDMDALQQGMTMQLRTSPSSTVWANVLAIATWDTTVHTADSSRGADKSTTVSESLLSSLRQDGTSLRETETEWAGVPEAQWMLLLEPVRTVTTDTEGRVKGVVSPPSTPAQVATVVTDVKHREAAWVRHWLSFPLSSADVVRSFTALVLALVVATTLYCVYIGSSVFGTLSSTPFVVRFALPSVFGQLTSTPFHSQLLLAGAGSAAAGANTTEPSALLAAASGSLREWADAISEAPPQALLLQQVVEQGEFCARCELLEAASGNSSSLPAGIQDVHSTLHQEALASSEGGAVFSFTQVPSLLQALVSATLDASTLAASKMSASFAATLAARNYLAGVTIVFLTASASFSAAMFTRASNRKGANILSRTLQDLSGSQSSRDLAKSARVKAGVSCATDQLIPGITLGSLLVAGFAAFMTVSRNEPEGLYPTTVNALHASFAFHAAAGNATLAFHQFLAAAASGDALALDEAMSALSAAQAEEERWRKVLFSQGEEDAGYMVAGTPQGQRGAEVTPHGTAWTMFFFDACSQQVTAAADPQAASLLPGGGVARDDSRVLGKAHQHLCRTTGNGVLSEGWLAAALMMQKHRTVAARALLSWGGAGRQVSQSCARALQQEHWQQMEALLSLETATVRRIANASQSLRLHCANSTEEELEHWLEMAVDSSLLAIVHGETLSKEVHLLLARQYLEAAALYARVTMIPLSCIPVLIVLVYAVMMPVALVNASQVAASELMRRLLRAKALSKRGLP